MHVRLLRWRSIGCDGRELQPSKQVAPRMRTDDVKSPAPKRAARFVPAPKLFVLEIDRKPILAFEAHSARAVSYTHLDVYKRQIASRSSPSKLILHARRVNWPANDGCLTICGG